MSLDNATRCCRSLLANERVSLISVEDLLATELKKCDLPSGHYYRMPLLMGGTAPLMLSLGTMRVLYCAARCETGFQGKEKKTLSLLAVFEGDSISERLERMGLLETHMQGLLGDGVAEYLNKNQLVDMRMNTVNKKLSILDRSRLEEGSVNRLPTISMEINETQTNLRPSIAHMNRDKREFRPLEGSLADHIKSLEYTHAGPSGDEIRYRPFSLQGACVQITHCTVTAQYKSSVKLILREASINLDTLSLSSANANAMPNLPPCDMVASILENNVILGRPIEMSEETLAMGWKDGIWKSGTEQAREHDKLFGRVDYTNAIFDLTPTPARAPNFIVYNPEGLVIQDTLFMTDFGDERKKKGTSESVSTRFKVRLMEGARLKRIVLRTYNSSVGFVSELKHYGDNHDNFATQASVSIASDLPIIHTLNGKIKELLDVVLKRERPNFQRAKGGKAYCDKMVEAIEHFSINSIKYNSIKIELAQRPGARAFATTRTRIDDRLVSVSDFVEGLIRPIRFESTACELEGVSYSSVSDSWTCQITCKEVIAPAEVHSSGQASMLMPDWFIEEAIPLSVKRMRTEEEEEEVEGVESEDDFDIIVAHKKAKLDDEA
jgi:hypothetical protein